VVLDSILSFSGRYCNSFIWQDECVVFYEPSNQTHLIDSLGCAILSVVTKKPINRSTLLIELKNGFELPNGSDIERALDNLIFEYQKLGILEVREI